VDDASTPPYEFSDLLVLARLSWLREMSAQLRTLGFDRFTRGDSAVMRLVARGPVPLGRTGAALGISRQASRKLVDRLERQGYVRTERDVDDARVINVVITPDGDRYARALSRVADRLNRQLEARVDHADLVAADTVLRAFVTDPGLAERIDSLVPRPG
jgi:DNA-binding MarR family transcriptional regulator